MSTFSPEELNFSDSALNHFSEMLNLRGKGTGIKIGVKEAGALDMNIHLILLMMLLRIMLALKKKIALSLLTTKVLIF